MLLRAYRALRRLLRMPIDQDLKRQADQLALLEALEAVRQTSRDDLERAEKALLARAEQNDALVRQEAMRLSDQLNLALRDLSLMARRQIDFQRETRLLMGQMTLPPAASWRVVTSPGAGHDDVVFSESALCRQESFEEPFFAYWMEKLDYDLRYHRKLWEFSFICQALMERNLVREHIRGLGFGVGEERLPAYFASRGMKITGTDMAPQAAADSGWVETAQHASGKNSMRYPGICPDDLFDANVDFRFCDMNQIPADLKGYDICWSACALEHLGSIDLGLKFIENSLDCLRPGGFAIHTTEFNLSSDNETVDNNSTVLFRAQDMDRLAKHLAKSGHNLAPLNLDPGSKPLDRYIDVAPYRDEPHLKLALDGYVCTSIGLIVQKSWS